ncbi:MAG: hydantoinase/oxoprolinase family protein, partial [Alphaproteobacteria bacterium]|nr:hydantoinase/oxoprolinase family protein [Alphaproteobacteria bacterium]
AVADAVDGERRIYLDGGAGWSMVPVLRRERLPAARPFEGPCVVEEATSTTLVPAGLGGRVDGYGNIILTREGKGDD